MSRTSTIITGTADEAVAKNKIVVAVSPSALTREPADFAIEVSGADGPTAVPLGVSQSAATAVDDPVDVCVGGFAWVKAGGTVAPGDLVESDASGDAITASGAGDHFTVGIACEDASDDDIMKIWVRPLMVTI